MFNMTHAMTLPRQVLEAIWRVHRAPMTRQLRPVVQSVLIEILECVDVHDARRTTWKKVSSIVDATGFSRSTVHRCIAELTQRGLIERMQQQRQPRNGRLAIVHTRLTYPLIDALGLRCTAQGARSATTNAIHAKPTMPTQAQTNTLSLEKPRTRETKSFPGETFSTIQPRPNRKAAAEPNPMGARAKTQHVIPDTSSTHATLKPDAKCENAVPFGMQQSKLDDKTGHSEVTGHAGNKKGDETKSFPGETFSDSAIDCVVNLMNKKEISLSSTNRNHWETTLTQTQNPPLTGSSHRVSAVTHGQIRPEPIQPSDPYRRGNRSIPQELVPLITEHALTLPQLFWLMAEATRHRTRLGTVLKCVWHRMPNVQGRQCLAWLIRLIRSGQDFDAQLERQRKKADRLQRKAEAQRCSLRRTEQREAERKALWQRHAGKTWVDAQGRYHRLCDGGQWASVSSDRLGLWVLFNYPFKKLCDAVRAGSLVAVQQSPASECST